MSTILLTWELGSGLGHMSHLRPVAAGLLERGHQVVVALKNLASAGKIFTGLDVTFLPAPRRSGEIANRHRQVSTFPQLLHNCGFGDALELETLVLAWRAVLELVRPDAIVANFSPAVMLAARGGPARVVPLGTGFECPDFRHPFPNWRPELGNDPNQLLSDEHRVLDNCNAVVQELGGHPLTQLTDLYRDVADTLLFTYPELDPYPPRPEANYLGTWPDPPGTPPAWPSDGRIRVFVYLRPLWGIHILLRVLVRLGYSTIVRMPEASKELRDNFAESNICWEQNLLDLGATLRECDICVCHASHVMSAAMLHAGKPILMLPPYLEQRLTALRIDRLGAGIISSIDNEARLEWSLKRLIDDVRFREAAQDFARKYPSVLRHQRAQEAVDRVARLLR